MEKLCKGNSILFNQLWINKVIEDGNMQLLLCRKLPQVSIGEYIETCYELNDIEPQTEKITERNSILYTKEWVNKFIEEGLEIPRGRFNHRRRSLGQVLSTRYYQLELRKRVKHAEEEIKQESSKVLELRR